MNASSCCIRLTSNLREKTCAVWATPCSITKGTLWAEWQNNMNAAQVSVQQQLINPYSDIYEQFVVDAAFLWLLRSVAVIYPYFKRDAMAALDQRIDAQLNGLMTA